MKDSEELWKAWGKLLRRLYDELRYTAAPFDVLIKKVKKDDLKALPWIQCDPSLASANWREEEKIFATGLFSRLGMTDLDGQLRHIERYILLAEQEEREACERCKRLSKAYVTTGLCAGLCIGILLL